MGDPVRDLLKELAQVYCDHLDEHDRAMQFGGYVPIEDHYPVEVPLGMARRAFDLLEPQEVSAVLASQEDASDDGEEEVGDFGNLDISRPKTQEELMLLAISVLGTEALAREWMTTEQIGLGEETPERLVKHAADFDTVVDRLLQMASGVYC